MQLSLPLNGQCHALTDCPAVHMCRCAVQAVWLAVGHDGPRCLWPGCWPSAAAGTQGQARGCRWAILGTALCLRVHPQPSHFFLGLQSRHLSRLHTCQRAAAGHLGRSHAYVMTEISSQQGSLPTQHSSVVDTRQRHTDPSAHAVGMPLMVECCLTTPGHRGTSTGWHLNALTLKRLTPLTCPLRHYPHRLPSC
jgi:hypothetical protein